MVSVSNEKLLIQINESRPAETIRCQGRLPESMSFDRGYRCYMPRDASLDIPLLLLRSRSISRRQRPTAYQEKVFRKPLLVHTTIQSLFDKGTNLMLTTIIRSLVYYTDPCYFIRVEFPHSLIYEVRPASSVLDIINVQPYRGAIPVDTSRILCCFLPDPYRCLGHRRRDSYFLCSLDT